VQSVFLRQYGETVFAENLRKFAGADFPIAGAPPASQKAGKKHAFS
jgi:hypothetical protein